MLNFCLIFNNSKYLTGILTIDEVNRSGEFNENLEFLYVAPAGEQVPFFKSYLNIPGLVFSDNFLYCYLKPKNK